MTVDSALQQQLSKIGGRTTCPAAVIVREGKILSGLRHYTPDKWKMVSVWTLPGGRCDDGETVEAALLREVREETGITELHIERFLGQVPGAKAGDVVPLFLCRAGQEARLMEPEKFSEWRWFGIDAIPEPFINDAVKEAIIATCHP